MKKKQPINEKTGKNVPGYDLQLKRLLLSLASKRLRSY
ncbi:hypothetical protein ADICYQ_2568 [Cyclobacterium qasimii M12-11B]|uniref:Uncharacterized protein n=1 Tax=Cyclobacterium qasimii M12-11B TaxID=641524 RepID=S7WWT5_9BACT|nr:hypothetical protein ADICYQ_2568 [Cyclobacterium qasimii M12-11B]